MRQGLRQSMAWLHAWSGLVVGWVLFAVFVTGTASYYKDDISAWMRPELRLGVEHEPGQVAERAAAFLAREAPDAGGWFIELPKAEDPVATAHWWKTLEGPFHKARLDPETGARSAARDTRGGDFLYRFHFELSMPPLTGRWVVGTCALVLLVALISGIVTHRRIFADLFTFRRSKARQRSWLDAHNVAGVLALPFHLMITYTGLVTLAPMYMPWGASTAYKGEELRFFTESGMMPETRMPAGRSGTLAPLGPMVREAIERAPATPIEGIGVQNPADAHAAVIAYFEEPHGLAHLHPQVAFEGTTGAYTGKPSDPGPVAYASTAFIGLHEAHFAGPVLRVLFFLCGILGAATVATGLVLWTVARVPKPGERTGFGLRLVQILNVGTVAGLPAGIAAYFLANRLLPLDLAGRAGVEIGAFFGLWALVAVAACLRPHRAAWREGLALAALLFLAVPLVDAATVGSPFGDGMRFLAFDTVMIAIGGGLAFAAHKAGSVARRGQAATARQDLAREGFGRA